MSPTGERFAGPSHRRHRAKSAEITLPDALQKTPAEFEHEARLAMAVKLFEMKRLSSGQAALLAGIDRTTFLMQLSEQGVAMIDLPPEELADDVRHAGSK